MLNWIVWTRTDYLYKNEYGITYKGWYAITPKQPNNHLEYILMAIAKFT